MAKQTENRELGKIAVTERIVINREIAGGAPVIRGSQIPVYQVLDRIAVGKTPAEIIVELPQLKFEDVQAVLAYAADLVRQQTGDDPSLDMPETALHPASSATGSLNDAAALDLNTILVVDDQEINRLYMQTMFRDTGFKISVASSGEEALAKARAELPFLILTDVQMPLMDGFELCRQLKSDEKTKAAAVIFVTAHHRTSRKVIEGLEIGADDYIFRPFERGEMLSRIKAVARLKRAEEDARRQALTVARHNKALELLNELALAVTSSLDLEEIISFSTEKLSQVLDAEAIALVCLEPDTRKLQVNVASRLGKRVSRSLNFAPDQELADQTIQQHVHPIFSNLFVGSSIELADAAALDYVPMISKEQIIGAIVPISKTGARLTDSDTVLLKSAAGIVAVAVENARLLQNVQHQVVDLILLNEIGHALTSTLDLDQILGQTTQMVQESLRAELASLWLLDEDDQELVLTASFGLDKQSAIGSRIPIDGSIAGHVILTGEPHFSSVDVGDIVPHVQMVNVDDFSAGSILCVPVRAKDEIIGVVQARHHHSNWFDQNDLRLLYSVASSVGIAIENARLFGEVQEFSRRLERKVAERTRELAEEKEKTDAILASMADGLLVLDAENHILTSNAVAERLLGFQLVEAQGQPIEADRFDNPLWQNIRDLVERDELTNSALMEVPDPASLDGFLSIQALAARIRDELEQVLGTVIVLRDITAITEVERMKASFMSGITHELKTPLSVIRLHANNLQTYYDRLSALKRSELLNGIQSQVKLLEQLVEDILTLSRLDTSKVVGERLAIDLAELVDDVITDLRPLATAKHISVRWTPPSEEIKVLAERDHIRQLIRNLVDNAIKYTPAGGIVELVVAADRHSTAMIRVTDNGIGIPPEHQSRVFDRFYRVDSSHTIPGTGLGLSIVEEIVTNYGGDIQLESSPGIGSSFTIRLPTFDPPPITVSTEHNPTT
jgi:PAS domain S-box-containing protein